MREIVFARYDGDGGDLSYIARHMRAKEVQELAGGDPYELLHLSARMSYEAYIAKYQGRALCAFGVGAGEEGKCGVWLLGTPELGRFKREFLLCSERWVREFAGKYGALYNYVPDWYGETGRWLSWLGFAPRGAVPTKSGTYRRWELAAPGRS